MTLYKKLAKLVNMIKKYRYLLIFILLFSSKGNTLSPPYEKELFKGCYINSAMSLGVNAAKRNCNCIVNTISKNYTDKELKNAFKTKHELTKREIEFIEIECAKGK